MFLVGDAIEEVAKLPDSFIDLTLFSPPYDGIREYGKDWTIDLAELGRCLYEKTVDGGVCCVIIGDGTHDGAKTLTSFRMTVDWADAGWRLFECCLYQRHGKPGAWWSKRFRVDHEYIMIFFKGKRVRTFDKSTLAIPSKNAGKTWTGTQRHTSGELTQIVAPELAETKCRGTIWPYSASNTEGNKIKMEHPGTFPDALAKDVISCFSLPGDLILDPMCGSGTTVIQALNLGRDAIGVDVNADYIDIAERRVAREVHGPVAE